MIKILLVDDHELVRTGIAHLLNESEDMQVIGTASSGEEAFSEVERLSPDVVLMDINMPGLGGIEATRKILQKHPDVKIIALSVYAEGPFPQQLLRSGAHGYVSKGCPVTELLQAVRAVAKGKRYLSQDVASRMALASVPGHAASPFEKLSGREFQVVTMTLQGKSIQEMADELLISPKTVSTYRYRIFEKLSIRNDVELTRLATRYHLISDMPTA